MPAGTKIRTLSRLLDASPAPLWVISSDGKLSYLSAAVGTWLGMDPQVLIDRRSVAGSPISDDPLDYIAAALSAPPGFDKRGTASLRVQPPAIDGRKVEPLDVRFVRMGVAGQSATVAIGGAFQDVDADIEIRDAVALRRRLDAWRKRHTAIATIATAGVSASARRMRARLEVAAKTRSHFGIFGPKGCGAQSIASRIHQLSAPGESLICVNGPLMDAELLDASVVPLVNQLAESKSATATVLLSDLDETPIEAQQRLSELMTTFGSRMRLIGLCSTRPAMLSEPLTEINNQHDELSLEEGATVGLHPQLVDALSCLNVCIDALANRVEDIPVLATAMLDARQAAGEGAAERLSRAALDALVIYPWPGNFDELDAAIRYAIQTAPHASIGVEHLPLAIRSYRPGENPTSPKVHNVSLDEAVRRYENRIIHEVLAAADGNRAETARRLGISRARLLRKLEDEQP